MRRTGTLVALVAVALGTAGVPSLTAQEQETEVERNVIYGMVSGAALLMDVYRPPEPNGVGIVWIWGSGWQAPPPYRMWQLKGRGVPQPVLDMGYTVFVINHRGTPMFRYPAAVEDAQRAVRFIRSNAERWSIDPDRLGGWGGSSGAHLVSMLGTMDGDGRPEDPDPVERESSRLQVVVARAAPTELGVFDGPRGIAPLVSFMGAPPNPNIPTFREASPVTHASPDDAPLLLIHGDADPVVPFEQSELLRAALEEQSAEVELIRVPGGNHGANDLPATFRWLNRHLLDSEQAEDLESVIEASERLRAGLGLAYEGQIEEAVAAFRAAPELDARLTLTAGNWNALCWQGGLWGQPEQVIQACDRAVELDPEHLEYQDSRGLVRALLGDTERAIQDFEFFLERIQNPNRKAQRQGWVDALRAGENPFTPELLAALRGG
jgi:acetyl esterase/lipase